MLINFNNNVEFIDTQLSGVMYMHDEEYVNNNLVRQRTIVQHMGPQTPFNHSLITPQIPMKFWEMLHEFSLFLLVDDKDDLGKFTYYDRDDHYYHFRHSPHHPSPLHHWQVAIIGLFVSQMGALFTKAAEMRKELKGTTQPQQYQKPVKVIDLMQFPNSNSVVEVPSPKALPEPTNLFDKINHALDIL